MSATDITPRTGSGDTTTVLPDTATQRDAYRAADLSGKPVIWQGQTIHPDYRPGHTTHPEIRGHV